MFNKILNIFYTNLIVKSEIYCDLIVLFLLFMYIFLREYRIVFRTSVISILLNKIYLNIDIIIINEQIGRLDRYL